MNKLKVMHDGIHKYNILNAKRNVTFLNCYFLEIPKQVYNRKLFSVSSLLLDNLRHKTSGCVMFQFNAASNYGYVFITLFVIRSWMEKQIKYIEKLHFLYSLNKKLFFRIKRPIK